jgi:excisionase family DNA binding protein
MLQFRMSDGTEYLKVEEVADAMDVHPETVRRWVRKGLFPNVIKAPAGQGWRIPREDVEALKRVRR